MSLFLDTNGNCDYVTGVSERRREIQFSKLLKSTTLTKFNVKDSKTSEKLYVKIPSNTVVVELLILYACMRFVKVTSKCCVRAKSQHGIVASNSNTIKTNTLPRVLHNPRCVSEKVEWFF